MPTRSARIVLAYNLGNFMHTLSTPKAAKMRLLISLHEKLIKIGAKVVSHGRYIIFQIAEFAVPRQMIECNRRQWQRCTLMELGERVSTSEYSQPGFDSLLPHAKRDLLLPKMPKARILPSQGQRYGNIGLDQLHRHEAEIDGLQCQCRLSDQGPASIRVSTSR